jgi:hypothetical protein
MRAFDKLNSHLRIGARIGLGFAVVLTLIMVVAATVCIGLTIIRGDFHE